MLRGHPRWMAVKRVGSRRARYKMRSDGAHQVVVLLIFFCVVVLRSVEVLVREVELSSLRVTAVLALRLRTAVRGFCLFQYI